MNYITVMYHNGFLVLQDMAGFVLKNILSDNGGVTRGICKMDTENVSVEIIDLTQFIILQL